MCQQGGENVDAFHFHRDPLVQYHMGNVINQLVFVEKVSEKRHFLNFLDFQILHFQGNPTSLSQYGYFVMFCSYIYLSVVFDGYYLPF